MVQAFSCHFYDYQMIISKHGNCCVTKKWLEIWITSWKLTTKWLMYNDMGNVDHLSTYLPTRPSPTYLHTAYLPTHPLTYLPIHSPTYLLLTILQLAYYLFHNLIMIWNKHVKLKTWKQLDTIWWCSLSLCRWRVKFLILATYVHF